MLTQISTIFCYLLTPKLRYRRLSSSWAAFALRIRRPRLPSASTTIRGLFLVPEGTRSRSLAGSHDITTPLPGPNTRAMIRPPRKGIRGSLVGFHDASRAATTSERHVPSRSNERRSESPFPMSNGRTRSMNDSSIRSPVESPGTTTRKPVARARAMTQLLATILRGSTLDFQDPYRTTTTDRRDPSGLGLDRDDRPCGV